MKTVSEVIEEAGACNKFVLQAHEHGEDFDAAWEALIECDPLTVVDFVLERALERGEGWAYKCICDPGLSLECKAERIANAKVLAKALYEKLR